ncbi:hypothetical protein PAPYR_9254 [Paratrimastix pyriformis]|uniref:Uncharacterized protein n=1 Tax=Paratrimastix pyriformis TaxID=342808 RepID=A0ABQ8U8W7_9EUKA|nr:hypothetical protein PAPYR_9254 [Paratrimastix pyriformis]
MSGRSGPWLFRNYFDLCQAALASENLNERSGTASQVEALLRDIASLPASPESRLAWLHARVGPPGRLRPRIGHDTPPVRAITPSIALGNPALAQGFGWAVAVALEAEKNSATSSKRPRDDPDTHDPPFTLWLVRTASMLAARTPALCLGIVRPLVGLVADPKMAANLDIVSDFLEAISPLTASPGLWEQAHVADALAAILTAHPTMGTDRPALAQRLGLMRWPDLGSSPTMAIGSPALAEQLLRILSLKADAAGSVLPPAHTTTRGANNPATRQPPTSSLVQLAVSLVRHFASNPTCAPAHPALAQELLRVVADLTDASECRPALMQAGAATLAGRLVSACHPNTLAATNPDLAQHLIRVTVALFTDPCRHTPVLVQLTGALVEHLALATAHPALAQKLLGIIATLAGTPRCGPLFQHTRWAEAVAIQLGSPAMRTDPAFAQQLFRALFHLAATPGFERQFAQRVSPLLWDWLNATSGSQPFNAMKFLEALDRPCFDGSEWCRLPTRVFVPGTPVPVREPDPAPRLNKAFDLLVLPDEMLANLFRASADPLGTYLLLIGLTHRFRAALRGTPVELAFHEDPDLAPEEAAPLPTTEALAAIVGPCKDLRTLALPRVPLPEYCECSFRPAGPRGPLLDSGELTRGCPWIGEAFKGHERLERLELPVTRPFLPLLPTIVALLPGLQSLRLDTSWLQGATFHPGPVAAKLTHLTCAGPQIDEGELLRGHLLGKLDELRLLSAPPSEGWMAALTHSADRLGSLSLVVGPDTLDLLVPALPTMPRLTRLEMTCNPGVGLELCSLLPPLLPGLQALALRLLVGDHDDARLHPAPDRQHVLDCPALDELVLPTGGFARLELGCPRLTSLEGPARAPAHYNLPCPSGLARVVLHSAPTTGDHPDHTAAWLAAAPRLREYASDAPCPAPAPLWASRMLTRLRVDLDVAAFPLRLPMQLEHLVADLSTEEEGAGAPRGGELALAGPGLRCLTMRHGPSYCRLALHCPALEVLRLEMPDLRAFRMDPGVTPPLRSLSLQALGRVSFKPEPAALLDFLARHGDRLRHLALSQFYCFPAWPQLAAALGRLPRLSVLHLARRRFGTVALACPRLRICYLSPKTGGPVVLNCPALETIHGAQSRKDRVMAAAAIHEPRGLRKRDRRG